MPYEKSVLVLGATGTIGSGVVSYYLREGKTLVIAPIKRMSEKLTSALEGVSHINYLQPEIPYYDEKGPEKLAAWIKENVPGGKVDHILSIASGMAPLVNFSNITFEQYRETFDVKVYSQMKFAQELLPVLNDLPTSSYSVVNGGLGEKCYLPIHALTTMANAALIGMASAIESDSSSKAYRIIEFRISVLTRVDFSGKPNDPTLPDVSNLSVAEFYDKKIVQSDSRGVVKPVKTDILSG